jgi:hypothetical protein
MQSNYRRYVTEFPGKGLIGRGAEVMPLDTWEENSAFEIGTPCLRLPHPVGRQQAFRTEA